MGSDDLKTSIALQAVIRTRVTAFFFLKHNHGAVVKLSILVENRFGVLTQVTSFFSARGHSIESMVAVKCGNSDQASITVDLECPPSAGEQLIQQLHKLTDVIEAKLQHQ